MKNEEEHKVDEEAEMTIPSWEGLDDLALAAAEDETNSLLSRGVFQKFYEAIREELQITQSPGDRYKLARCIGRGMQFFIEQVQLKDPMVEQPAKNYKIIIPGHKKAKYPDYTLKKSDKYYLIEQKSFMRFNDFAALYMEALIAKSVLRENLRFAGLFNHNQESREYYDGLCQFGGKRVVDYLCVLIPGPYISGFSGEEIDRFSEDILEWFK